MKIGDIYHFDIPFDDGSGSKVRPVVILGELEDGVVVIESTSKFKPNLELIHTIDFEHPRYYEVRVNGLTGKSYFYRERWGVRPRLMAVRQLGALKDVDIDAIFKGLGAEPQ